MRPLIRPAILALALMAGISSPLASLTLPGVQRASGYCITAEKAMRAGNFKKARLSLQKALQIVPTFPAAHMGMGHLALSEKRYQDALVEYQQARDQFSEVSGALFALHVQDYTDSRYEIVALQDEIRNQQKLAPVFFRLNRLEAAVERLQRMDPPSRSVPGQPPAEIYFYLGNVLFHLDRVPEAVSSWETCLGLNRQFPLAYQNLAVGYWRMGKIDEARNTIAAAQKLGIRVDPGLKVNLDERATSDRATTTARP